MSSKPCFFCERQVIFFLMISKYFTSSWEDEAALCSSMVVAILWWDKRTCRTIKSSMMMSLPWLLFVSGGKRIMTPPTYCTSLFQREELCPGSALLEGRSLLHLLGAMPLYNKEPGTPSPEGGTLFLFRVFSHIKVNPFSLSLLLFYMWRSFDNICRV